MKEIGALVPIPLYRLKSFLMHCTVEVPLLVSLAIVQGVFSSDTLGQIYAILLPKSRIAPISVFPFPNIWIIGINILLLRHERQN